MNLDFFNSRNIQNPKNNFISSFLKELNNALNLINNPSLNKKLNSSEKLSTFTIDRFEGNFAVCENSKTEEMVDIHKRKLPKGAQEGDIIQLKQNSNKK